MMAGLIIAGGRARRMEGVDKLTARLGADTVLGRVAACIGPQVDHLALNLNRDVERFADLHLPILTDDPRFTGNPLAGMQAGLSWARALGATRLLTVSGDTPFLPHDLVARLAAAGEGAVIAASGGRRHPLIGLWPVSLLPALEDFLKGGPDCRIGDWARAAQASTAGWPATPIDPFFNINTQADLDQARDLAEHA